ncbi:hypothetical protein GYMLUDRAFT_1008372 [Collybiopsis luxurians FD-317 M1]|nr:hypothetical protein GYMLUDRAFT_1008372 [Collybiopsis luxurians FD-317 M1]
MLAKLPAELILSVLHHVDLRCVHALMLVSKRWKHFLDQNESSVYHALAVQHGYIPSTALDFSRLSSMYSPKFLEGVTSWKSFCKRRVHVDKSWAGKAASRYIAYNGTGSTVHRIKVDEKAGFIITSFRGGGLTVCDIKTNETYVKQYAHLEYEQGYLIFDRLGGSKEVWRLASDFLPETSQTKTIPEQVATSDRAFQEHSATYPKGHFRAWAILQMPRPTRAFRFSYPCLLVGAWDHAFLWDIPSSELIQTISSIQQPEDPAAAFAVVLANAPAFDAPAPRLSALQDLNYVEVDSRHVFVCGFNALRVFSRASGKCVLDVPSARREFGHRKFKLLEESDKTEDAVLVNQHTNVEELDLSISRLPQRTIDQFVAVHVSCCGKHLVAMLASSRIVIIENFEEGPGSLFGRMIQIQLGCLSSHSQYLAIHQDHVAVATVRYTKSVLFLFPFTYQMCRTMGYSSSPFPPLSVLMPITPWSSHGLRISDITYT